MRPDLILFLQALKDLARPKRLAIAVLLAVFPAAAAVIWRLAASTGGASPEAIYNSLEPGVVFGFTLVILAVVFGTGVIAQEVEQKTIVYLLTRPAPRWRIATAKYLAAVVAVTVTVLAASLALALTAYGPRHLGASRLGRDLLILPIGALAYSALFLLMAALTRQSMIYGLIFAFGWETWVPALPGDFQKLSLMAYLRVLAPHPASEQSAELKDLLSAMMPQTITHALAWTVLGGVIAGALVVALVLFSLREYVPREDVV